jgi:SAM-dependent methyltransferase
MRFVQHESELRLWPSFRRWWSEQSQVQGRARATILLAQELWGFLRDSTPERRRQRYGDMDYDWEHRVNTTSGALRWRERLFGVFHSPYQPTDEPLFRQMMASLPINFSDFVFIDLGSGKGRTLLMASEYPFRRIVGVEIVTELHRAALANIADYKSGTQACKQIDAVCADARLYSLPEDPLLIYLFNPLPEAGLRDLLENLQQSLQRNPRPAWLVYGNALLESVLAQAGFLQRVVETEQFVVYRALDGR